LLQGEIGALTEQLAAARETAKKEGEALRTELRRELAEAMSQVASGGEGARKRCSRARRRCARSKEAMRQG